MKLDLYVDMYRVTMDRPRHNGRLELSWSDTPADLWVATIHGRHGRFDAHYQATVKQSQEYYIPKLSDFLYTLQSMALSEELSNDERASLDAAYYVFGSGSIYDLINLDLFEEAGSVL